MFVGDIQDRIQEMQTYVDRIVRDAEFEHDLQTQAAQYAALLTHPTVQVNSRRHRNNHAYFRSWENAIVVREQVARSDDVEALQYVLRHEVAHYLDYRTHTGDNAPEAHGLGWQAWARRLNVEPVSFSDIPDAFGNRLLLALASTVQRQAQRRRSGTTAQALEDEGRRCIGQNSTPGRYGRCRRPSQLYQQRVDLCKAHYALWKYEWLPRRDALARLAEDVREGEDWLS